MSSFLFYDPNDNHSIPQLGPDGRRLVSQLDTDIVFIEHIDILRHSISHNHHFLQVVCICCLNKSSMIKELLSHQHIILIYVCRQHHGREEDPLFSPKVRDDLPLTRDSGWEFKGRLALVGESMRRRYNVQVLNELPRLRSIEQQFLSMP